MANNFSASSAACLQPAVFCSLAPEKLLIEIMEDYVLSVKTVFEGAVKDVPEDMLSKYCISDWYVRNETSVLVVLVWTNPHEQPNK